MIENRDEEQRSRPWFGSRVRTHASSTHCLSALVNKVTANSERRLVYAPRVILLIRVELQPVAWCSSLASSLANRAGVYLSAESTSGCRAIGAPCNIVSQGAISELVADRKPHLTQLPDRSTVRPQLELLSAYTQPAMPV